MRNLMDISTALAWFVLCIVVAVFLLVMALTYNAFVAIRKSPAIKKIEHPKVRLAR